MSPATGDLRLDEHDDALDDDGLDDHEPEEPTVLPGDGRPPRRSTPGRSGAAGRTTHRWARTLHVYTSMIALLVVLFFGITGITLNHPDLTFGDEVSVTTVEGTFPFDVTTDDGAVDFLAVAEYVRAEYDVKGAVDDYDITAGDGSIAFKDPGYAADLFFDVDDSTYELTVTQQGFVAVMNDLHKGRDAGSTWRWVIDVSAGFLVAISLTGLVMQFFLRRRRRSALTLAAVGAVATVVLIVITLS